MNSLKNCNILPIDRLLPYTFCFPGLLPWQNSKKKNNFVGLLDRENLRFPAIVQPPIATQLFSNFAVEYRTNIVKVSYNLAIIVGQVKQQLIQSMFIVYVVPCVISHDV